MVVALDGPAGAGKSTIAEEIARRTGFTYLNSGNFYRALTLAVIENNLQETDQILEMARTCRIEVIDKRFILNGRDVHDLLHSDAVDKKVAIISTIPELREIVTNLLRTIAGNNNIVMEGRDISTVVFPDAKVKVYLDASVETRARRRFTQGVSALSLEEIEDSIRKRDSIDQNKQIGALKKTEDAFYLDTSDLTIDQVCEKVISKISSKNQGPGR